MFFTFQKRANTLRTCIIISYPKDIDKISVNVYIAHLKDIAFTLHKNSLQ